MNNVLVEELTTIVHADQAQERGRELCLKLKDNLSREQFEYPIRASVNNRIIARETVKAYRKDVTAKVVSADRYLPCSLSLMKSFFLCLPMLSLPMAAAARSSSRAKI